METPLEYVLFRTKNAGTGSVMDRTGKCVASLVNKTNGPEIVRACNSYDALVETCKALVRAEEERDAELASDRIAHAMDLARAALALAKGE